MGAIDHPAEARRIVEAHARGTTLDPISDRVALGMDDAYRIQSLVTAERFERGERSIGWKLGYTSLAMREQMGVAEANFGPLTDAMLVEDGGDVAGRFTQPRVEPEVALVFARDVPGDADRDDVLACTARAHAALEIVDSVWTDYRFRIEDNTADGSSAAAVVIGPEIDVDLIADVEVTLSVGGEVVGRGRGRDASGHPADGIVWLVAQLRDRGARLRAGDLVITGGLTAAAPLAPGTGIEAAFGAAAGHPTVVRVRDGRTTLR
jgi:2-keto-4-pentenoate hydratase